MPSAPTLAKVLLVASATALLGCSALAPAPTSTPVPPTRTPLERQADALRSAYEIATPPDAWLARQGVRVIPALEDPNDLTRSCPKSYPVAGVNYGVYYLPTDELYPRGAFDTLLDLTLCFASEQDALAAGYRRGPHSAP